ncbi:tripartite motif-containing protein 16 [Aplochiton taeniatus]
MGASLDTPAQKTTVCRLCHGLYRDPVTLKCNHRFCKRCIGDLWSGSATGPYFCPEWRCKTEYTTLPFVMDDPRVPTYTNQRRRFASSGKSKEDGFVVVNPVGRTPSVSSLAGRLLGKRAASSPASEQQPDRKRAALDSGSSEDSEFPSTSSSSASSSSADRPGPSPWAPVPPGVEEGPAAGSSVSDDISSVCSFTSAVSDVTLTNETAAGADAPAQEDLDGPMKGCSDEPSDMEEWDGSAPLTASAPPRDPTPQTSPSKPTPPLTRSPAKNAPPPFQRLSWSSRLMAQRPVPAPPSSPARPSQPTSQPLSSGGGPVSCHYCPSPGQLWAVKTCLVCGASMCPEHLRPHLESPVFRSHSLVPAVEDISPWRCQEHQEMNRIYCQHCAVCVCTVCTVIGSHRDHSCVSIREAERELRGHLKEEIKQLQETEQALLHRVSEFKEKKQSFQVALDEAHAGVQLQYRAMHEALEQEEQTALLCVAQEQSKKLGGLEDQIVLLQESLTSVQKGLHTMEGLADAKGPAQIQEQAFIMEYSKVTQILNESGSCVKEVQDPEELDHARLCCLQRWTEKRLDTVVISMPDRDPYRLLYGTIPSLDPDTAHSKLFLSEDNRRVTYSESQQACLEQGARFSFFPQVLASRALEGGRWYWEVEVSGAESRWKVGVCEGQMGRKGQRDSCRLGFNPHSWCLSSEKAKVEALHDKVAVPTAAKELQKVGVFVDLEEGILSFYKVTPEGSLSLLHSFKKSFSEPLYPAFGLQKTTLAVCDLFHASDRQWLCASNFEPVPPPHRPTRADSKQGGRCSACRAVTQVTGAPTVVRVSAVVRVFANMETDQRRRRHGCPRGGGAGEPEQHDSCSRTCRRQNHVAPCRSNFTRPVLSIKALFEQPWVTADARL